MYMFSRVQTQWSYTPLVGALCKGVSPFYQIDVAKPVSSWVQRPVEIPMCFFFFLFCFLVFHGKSRASARVVRLICRALVGRRVGAMRASVLKRLGASSSTTPTHIFIYIYTYTYTYIYIYRDIDLFLYLYIDIAISRFAPTNSKELHGVPWNPMEHHGFYSSP